jgi:hypothetical protein
MKVERLIKVKIESHTKQEPTANDALDILSELR